MQRRSVSLLRAGLAVSMFALGLAGGAQAQEYSFSCISNNSATNCATGAQQFTLNLTQGAGYVDFKFVNLGLSASSITDIYFDWANNAAAFAPGTITDSGAGVDFSWGASPANLPGGQGLTTAFHADLGADSNAPTQPNGVNPGEWVSFRFLTGSTSTAEDLFTGALRVGIHAQGFADGGSESFVAIAAPVPEPEAYAMALVGLVAVAGLARRKRAT